MRVPKRQWIFVNHLTGEITQYMTPITIHRAKKYYENWHGMNEHVRIYERMKDIPEKI